MVATASELYVPLSDSLLVLDPETGDEKWRDDSRDTVNAVGDDMAYVTNGNVLAAVDSATGDERWQVETNRRESTDVVVAGGTIYCSITEDDAVADKLVLYDATTGDHLGTYELPTTADQDDGVLDATNYLTPAGGKLYTVSDNALVAFCDKSDSDSDGEDSDGDDTDDC
ncbi:outer membrane protein assembly factor BamB family protein [Haladaptatus litoreus]|uniref:outer membrane protein assembly factor BamB family protein n=1 Tax=Haladaptatus litoreus TaxID=553468 RepID=UPI0009711863|nr:PQQ-binding-like beta-propeller repeat protein [Haladaptatus litoreus]